MWRDILEIKDVKHIGGKLGWYGKIRPTPFSELYKKVKAVAGGISGQVYSSKETVESVALCTGLGGLITAEAAATGADVFITGELLRPAKHDGFNAVIEVGHTRSERIGVERIRQILGPTVEIDVAPLGIDRFWGKTGTLLHRKMQTK